MTAQDQKLSVWNGLPLFKSKLLTQWNLRAPHCNSLILICNNVFSMSPQRIIGLNLERINISHSRFCKGGPVSTYSFRLVEVWHSLAEASYSILIFAVSADSPITGLWARQNTLSPIVSFIYISTFSMIHYLFVPGLCYHVLLTYCTS